MTILLQETSASFKTKMITLSKKDQNMIVHISYNKNRDVGLSEILFHPIVIMVILDVNERNMIKQMLDSYLNITF